MSRRHIAPFGAFLILLIQVSFCPAAAPEKQTARADRPPSPTKDEYYEMYKVLVDTMDQVDRNYVKEIDRRELIEAAIKGVLSKLDPYSAYIGPEGVERLPRSVESEFGGIGIQIADRRRRPAGAQPDVRHSGLPRRPPGRRPDRRDRRQAAPTACRRTRPSSG